MMIGGKLKTPPKDIALQRGVSGPTEGLPLATSSRSRRERRSFYRACGPVTVKTLSVGYCGRQRAAADARDCVFNFRTACDVFMPVGGGGRHFQINPFNNIKSGGFISFQRLNCVRFSTESPPLPARLLHAQHILSDACAASRVMARRAAARGTRGRPERAVGLFILKFLRSQKCFIGQSCCYSCERPNVRSRNRVTNSRRLVDAYRECEINGVNKRRRNRPGHTSGPPAPARAPARRAPRRPKAFDNTRDVLPLLIHYSNLYLYVSTGQIYLSYHSAGRGGRRERWPPPGPRGQIARDSMKLVLSVFNLIGGTQPKECSSDLVA
ncbi:hypothetical protein EVAR_59352_1 [Eumeta japonica]|uniref:Uncharacterized protein n=1 Tax=Eumeta variegata TaxID=151549 RepID=A0A4C2A3Q7_EUMVA|nr:hypothetical protein EVAR_59352_1 [Eumeta japonica]